GPAGGGPGHPGIARALSQNQLARPDAVVEPNAELHARTGEHADSGPRDYARRPLPERIARRALQAGVSRTRRRQLAENDAREVGGRADSIELWAGGYVVDQAASAAIRRGEIGARSHGRAEAGHREGEAASKPGEQAALGRVRPEVAALDERDYLPEGYRGKSGHAGRERDNAHQLRFELSGRSLRFLRHAHQRQAAHGVLGSGGRFGTTHPD